MIRSDRLLYELAPEGYGERYCEPVEQWLTRAQPYLPHFPEEVLEQWIYRHWKGVLCHWGWLDFRAMSFSKQYWSTERILSQVSSPYQDVVEKLARRMSNPLFQQSWLVQRMQSDGTWPVAPIILHCDGRFMTAEGRELNAPYHLLEGHHRLGYLTAMAAQEINVLREHALWVVKISVH
ncbi:hypothetical protein [Photobacterium atrarenae]|uniref:Uncharacterized protein n=1 Tax=Photobacterium atrarenae TaxID=865757 RepID=A0ABY5GDP9_9GAMM|nr:hypothetical protein [Photobacterium atrarenae]UTV26844.1 hypothetical protein NNL38_10825 [Photobacterium atrarenae]